MLSMSSCIIGILFFLSIWSFKVLESKAKFFVSFFFLVITIALLKQSSSPSSNFTRCLTVFVLFNLDFTLSNKCSRTLLS